MSPRPSQGSFAVWYSLLRNTKPSHPAVMWLHGLSGQAVSSDVARLGLKLAKILLANSNQWYFNKLVKIPCHKTPYRCPHRLNLSSQSSRSCAGPNIKVLKDKVLEFANSIRTFFATTPCSHT